MKKITVLIWALSVSLCSLNAQPMASLEAGYSVGKTASVGFHAGYNWRALNVTAGAQTHVSSKVVNGIALEVRVGHEFTIGDGLYFNPFMGYARHLLSQDIKSLNSNNSLFGGEISKSIRYEEDDNVRVYLAGTRTGQWTFLTIGIKGIF